ncbi:MAG TPA: ATP cone domain-containing protein [Planctomycetota bacterium]|nr:ATP cone domain-containing protein [Planctomycetota bacterium]
MPAPKWVRKRDGRPEPYEESKVARAIALAAKDAGRRDGALDLARELARSVTFYLGRGDGRTPDTRQIAEAVERALSETGHAAAAERFREHREWRTSRRAAVSVRENAPPKRESVRGRLDEEEITDAVLVLSSAGSNPWSKRRIVEALTREAGLPEEQAEDVARAVEERVFASGLNRVGSSLLRELIDAELFERGFSAQLGKLEVVGVAKPDLKRFVFLEGVRAPSSVEAEVARNALERYALDDLVGGDAAAAHRRGEIHLVGLGRPLRLAAGGASAPEVARFSGEPKSALGVARALVRAARASLPCYDLAFGLARTDAAFAPFARGPELADAVGVVLDAACAPSLEEACAPELVLCVSAEREDDAQARARDALLDAFLARGKEAAGARLAVVVRPRPGPDARAFLERAIEAARRGAPVELALVGRGASLATSRGHAGGATPCAATQIACLDFARTALEAGRGERERLSHELARAMDLVLAGLHERRRFALSAIVRPVLPLWRPKSAEPPAPAGLRPRELEPDAVADVLALVGLEAGLRYFAGESPAENRRVARLAREVVLEIATLARAQASRLGLALRFEDAPAGEAPERLAALDLERYEDGRELVEGRGGWDPGLSLGGMGQDPVGTVEIRFEIAQALGVALALPRSSLAVADPGRLAARIVEILGREEPETAAVASPSASQRGRSKRS